MGDPIRETKPKQSQDPAPKQDSARDPMAHAIRVDPPELVKTVLLGGKQRLRYSVDNLRTGSHLQWHHTSSGSGGSRKVEHRGPTSEINEVASHAGERELDTTVDVDGRRETAASTTLKTPRSSTRIIGMWGESKERGRTPVAHTMQSNEDLVLHVELPNVDASVDEAHARFDDSVGLLARAPRKLGEKKFEVVARVVPEATHGKDAKTHAATGALMVTPRGVYATSVDPTPVSLHIEVGPTNQDDFGKRPASTAIAVNRAIRRWNDIYDSRIEAIGLLMKQIEVTDPVPADPILERLLKAAAMIALNAVTAGVGAGIVRNFSQANGFEEGRKEFAKVLIEQTTASVVEAAVGHAMSEAGKSDPVARKTGGGTLLSPEIYFEWTQRAALREAKLDHLTRVESTLTSLTSRLDRDHPSTGYRAAIDAHDAIESQNKFAGDLQFSNSLSAWCTFSAQARLGVGDQTRGRDRGTELGTQVDVKRIVPKGNVNPRNLEKTPGVLRLELAEIAPGHVIVVRSFIAGFKGDTAVGDLIRKVQDLHIPIVARFNQRDSFGKLTQRAFVISRNENGAVLADSKRSLMQDMFGGKSDLEAGRLVFEQIAHQTVTPERG